MKTVRININTVDLPLFLEYKNRYFNIRNELIDYILGESDEIPIVGNTFSDEVIENRLLGCFRDSSYSNSGVVEIASITHIIKNVYMINNQYYADIIILDTPNGKILKELDESNLCLAPQIFNGKIITLNL